MVIICERIIKIINETFHRTVYALNALFNKIILSFFVTGIPDDVNCLGLYKAQL